MDAQTQKLAVETTQKPKRKPNRGSFRPGDKRINREGRPTGSKLYEVESPLDLAQRTDRVLRMFVRDSVLCSCISQIQGPRISNLPDDFRIVGCRRAPELAGTYFIVRSDRFSRVARGAEIPEFEPKFSTVMLCQY